LIDGRDSFPVGVQIYLQSLFPDIDLIISNFFYFPIQSIWCTQRNLVLPQIRTNCAYTCTCALKRQCLKEPVL